MVGIFKGGEAAFFRATFEPVVFRRHFQGDLDGGGAVVGVKDPRERPGREEPDQFFREADSRFVREPQKGAVRQHGRLLSDRRDYCRM